jgi:ketosteroid isomerase-like protein
MRPLFVMGLLAGSMTLSAGVRAAEMQAPTQQVQQELIALDKKWGETLDKAVLDKLIADNALVVGPQGEGGGKKEQIAAMTATPTAGYVADEYKFEMLTPDIVLMTHRGSSTSKEKGKDVKESHRSLHVFQKVGGSWQVVGSAQTPISKP